MKWISVIDNKNMICSFPTVEKAQAYMFKICALQPQLKIYHRWSVTYGETIRVFRSDKPILADAITADFAFFIDLTGLIPSEFIVKEAGLTWLKNTTARLDVTFERNKWDQIEKRQFLIGSIEGNEYLGDGKIQIRTEAMKPHYDKRNGR